MDFIQHRYDLHEFKKLRNPIQDYETSSNLLRFRPLMEKLGHNVNDLRLIFEKKEKGIIYMCNRRLSDPCSILVDISLYHKFQNMQL